MVYYTKNKYYVYYFDLNEADILCIQGTKSGKDQATLFPLIQSEMKFQLENERQAHARGRLAEGHEVGLQSLCFSEIKGFQIVPPSTFSGNVFRCGFQQL